jgi:nucleotide-binding universal stress UspA family protein
MERERVPDAYRDTHGDSLPEHYYDVIFERNTSDVVAKIRKAGILFEAIPGIGSPTKFITETAKSKRPDYIVIGMHGLHNIGKVRALGGVARRVLEEATVPVMAVPGTGKTRAA